MIYVLTFSVFIVFLVTGFNNKGCLLKTLHIVPVNFHYLCIRRIFVSNFQGNDYLQVSIFFINRKEIFLHDVMSVYFYCTGAFSIRLQKYHYILSLY